MLRQIAAPDAPKYLLEPVRVGLWEPETLHVLTHLESISRRELAVTCHALAA